MGGTVVGSSGGEVLAALVTAIHAQVPIRTLAEMHSRTRPSIARSSPSCAPSCEPRGGARLAKPDLRWSRRGCGAGEKGVRPQWQRWASVEAAVDGHMLCQTSTASLKVGPPVRPPAGVQACT
ncbi:hypothetical protein [Planotetraspora sp. GP83]|uniref:hypothetical protein n=1 Tax=Planotetraspora sp. GP83 TaxID=3156264 RepID=UPI003516C4C0